ncbi:hypothetical protein BZG04_15435 [Salinivibrio kushneri]|uniref:SMEK domain-containing protein n=1 Tax=Salinivibrio kushneri TaxID=1908198 RepID=UPI0009894888|nr:SMEK domain-containing protein [Salinivibrio kushneri]OOE32306.1 hypothetical protein BZG04_15435 [Salinivibrio kushneri]
MLNKEIALKDVQYWLSHLSTSARLGGKIHFFDLNIVAEDFYANLLNIIYGWDLVNLNHTNLNAVAVDLGDLNRRIAVQVTSDRTKAKIQKTIDKFEEHNLSNNFDKLKVVIIGERTRTNPVFNLPKSIVFDGRFDVLDDAYILSAISALPLSKIDEVLRLIKRDVIPKQDVDISLKHSDLEVLELYRDYFDRPALKDKWTAEGSYIDFQAALNDLITLMNTGSLQGKSITKRRFEIDDATIKNGLASVAEQLRLLRELFNCHVRSGDIDLTNNYANFQVQSKADAFDSFKGSVISELNLLLVRNSLSPII